MRFPLFLPDEERVKRSCPIMGGRVSTPLLQPLPFGWIIKVLPALRLDDPDFLLDRLTMKSG